MPDLISVSPENFYSIPENPDTVLTWDRIFQYLTTTVWIPYPLKYFIPYYIEKFAFFAKIVVFSALIITIIRIILQKSLFFFLGQKFLKIKYDLSDFHLKNDKRKINLLSKLNKWIESCWNCTLYTFSFMWGFVTLSWEYWFFTPTLWWKGWSAGHHLTFYISFLYYFEGGMYLHLLFFHFFGNKKKDFFVMILHHIIALSLVSLSYSFYLYRIGSVIFILLDISDIFLELSKMFLYGGKRYREVNKAIFCLFCVIFFVTRIVIFPLVIERSSFIDTLIYLPYISPFWVIFQILLFFVFLLQVYWFVLIVKMVLRVIKNKNSDDVKDVRSDSES